MLSLKNISVEFGGIKAITDVSFEVEKNSLFSIIGPNGAGKTTLLNVISGRYTPVSGEIMETNQPIVDDPSNVNKDPENNGWFFKIKVKDKSELDSLMSQPDYEKFVKDNPN